MALLRRATEHFAADIVGFLDAVGVEQAVIVGQSSGGLVSQLVASSHPKRVSALVLINSPATLADKPQVVALWEEIATLEDPLDVGYVTEFVRSTSPEGVTDELVAVLVKESLKAPARVWKETFRGLIEADLPVPLHRIAAPTLLVSGDQDTFAPLDQDVLIQGISNARLALYEGTGHGVHLVQPDRVIGDLMHFLATIDSLTG